MIDNKDAFLLMCILGLPILIITHVIRKRTIAYQMFSSLVLVYTFAVLSVTLFPIAIDKRLIFELSASHTHLSINLIPFKSIIGSYTHFYYVIGLRNILGNILLLLPLGFLLGIYRVKRIITVIIFGFAASLIIELMQIVLTFFNFSAIPRTFDVDDLILNTFGCLIGFTIYHGFDKLRRLIINKNLSDEMGNYSINSEGEEEG